MIPDDVRQKLEFLLQRAWVNADWRDDAEVVLDWLKTLPEPPRPNWDDAPGQARHAEPADAHLFAQIAQAEALTRIAEVLETMHREA